MRVEATSEGATGDQDGATLSPSQIAALEHHEREVSLKTSDLKLRYDQLIAQQAQLNPAERARLNSDVAQAQHDYVASQIELQATRVKLHDAKTPQATVATTEAAREPLFGRQQVEEGMIGAVILLFPLSIALARRVWMRTPSRSIRAREDENTQRLQRVEHAVESIALEVERIGEGQRFATRMLTDRQPDLVARHDAPPRMPDARVGSITPH